MILCRPALLLTAISVSWCFAQELKLPNKKESFHFAVLGDTGTGGTRQYEVAQQLETYRQLFPFQVALLLGDNIYGTERPSDFVRKFERPYESALKAGVKFYAALGNHDNPNQRNYKGFNMDGKRYYTFRPANGVRFFVLDSTYMSPEQLTWVEQELTKSNDAWKIAYFHHPLYSSGARHGPDEDLRRVLEPLFLKHGVSVVFAGHEHFYERLKPQKGIHHFIEGGSAKLRKGNIRRREQSAMGFDTDNSFMLCEIDGDRLHFQTISRVGQTVDSGVITRIGAPAESSAPSAQ
jgi:hypothetical protein